MNMPQPVASIVPANLDPRQAYRLAISIVVPRPIAWVSTVGLDGTLNLAPFSFFNVVGNYPLTMMVSIGQRKGQPKDTFRNATETGQFVINIGDESLLTALNESSGEWSYEVNEFEKAGVTPLASVDVRPPRVAEAPIAMECRLSQVVPVEGATYTMILGQVLRFHIRENLLKPDGLVDAEKLHPIARLGGDDYATLGTLLSLKRPVV